MSENLCYKCGSVLPQGCEYCPNCGAPAPLTDDEINRKAIIGHGIIVPPRGHEPAERRQPAPVAVPPPPPPPPFAGIDPDIPVDATDTVVSDPEAMAEDGSTRLLSKDDILAKKANPVPAPLREANQTQPMSPAGSAPAKPKQAPAKLKKTPETEHENNVSRKPWGYVAIASVLVLAVLAYIFIFKPVGSGSDAKHMFPISETELRQSAADAGSGNVITQIPFGAMIEVLDKTPEWAHVKYSPASGGRDIEGYVAAPALLEEGDFRLLCAILPGERERRRIALPHQRQALINYYRAHGMASDAEPQTDGSVVVEVPERWIYRDSRMPGNVSFVEDYFYGDNGSEYPDMAVMLTNNRTNDKLIIVYSFDDQGQPIFRYQAEASSISSGIRSITVDSATGRPEIICN